MLELRQITKQYQVADQTVDALKGIDLRFRENEFVSILGPSGCGKTTILNIIGGLDRYTTGDLVIGGVSTKQYKDRDWDNYRNHRIGFIFQSYNLIPHQTVLENVELALTLAGVSKAERRRRAIKLLQKVGLSDKLKNKPTQLSGGQCQRVAIARALINNPDILLADEPTGALDSKTSVQIMELLKEIAADKLVIMVTHNPELAEEYSTRIVRFLDGKLVDDSNPVSEEEYVRLQENDRKAIEEKKRAKKEKRKVKREKTSMSFFTALSLSLKNMLTKKGRTFLVSFAGSIGIIGIALVLSLSQGFQSYIDAVQKDTLSSYPITIQQSTIDYTSLFLSMSGDGAASEQDPDKIYVNDMMSQMLSAMLKGATENNLKDFKVFLDGNEEIKEYVSDIQYGYSIDLNMYAQKDGKTIKVNKSTFITELMGGYANSSMNNMTANMWSEILENEELMRSQYQVLEGRWPDGYNEIVLIADENNRISDYLLCALGFYDQDEMKELFRKALNQEEYELNFEPIPFSEILNTTYQVVYTPDYYQQDASGVWRSMRSNEAYIEELLASDKSETIKIVGIIKPAENTTSTALSGAIGYTSALTKHYIEKVNGSELVQAQLADPDTDVFTGKPFYTGTLTLDEAKQLVADSYGMTVEELELRFGAMQQQGMSESAINEYILNLAKSLSSEATYEGNLSLLDYADPASPTTINIYPVSFESKDSIAEIIDKYNAEQRSAGKEENIITYTDYIGLMMSSITTIINAVSYVLIAFVSISLVVSSIMIGIITYISVLERTKEIGILRAVGASKGNVSLVFNAEALIIGFAAGILGIGITYLLCIPINVIIQILTGIAALRAILPPVAAVILVAISMFLTFIAGLFPSRIAAKRDPVEALRTE